MTEFLLDTNNRPYLVALIILAQIGLLETLLMVIGLGMSSLLDNLLPDLDVDAPGEAGFLSATLDWLQVGKVPTIFLLILILAFFSVFGFAMQLVAGLFLSGGLTSYIVAPLAFAFGILTTRRAAMAIARFIPMEESQAVEKDQLIGKIARVVLGGGCHEKATQAKVTDENQKTHYVLVKAAYEGVSLRAGEEILLLDRKGSIYHAVAAPDVLKSPQ